MTNTAHTPTPWQTYDKTGTHICAGKKTLGLIHVKSAEELSQAQTDAAHIVRCVNAHDALVAALLNLTNWCAGGDIPQDLYDAARAALAAVEVKA